MLVWEEHGLMLLAFEDGAWGHEPSEVGGLRGWGGAAHVFSPTASQRSVPVDTDLSAE